MSNELSAIISFVKERFFNVFDFELNAETSIEDDLAITGMDAVDLIVDFGKEDELVGMIFSQPFTKVKHLQDAKIYAEATARDYLNQLCDIRVLEKKTIEGHHYYLNQELCRILAE